MNLLLGVLIGIIGHIIILICEFPALYKWGVLGVLELHESECIADKFLHRKAKNIITLSGMTIHFINGVIIGIVFYILLNIFNALNLFILHPLVLSGLIYGLIIFLITLAPVHKIITNTSILNHPLGRGPIFSSLIAHLIYGASLGIIIEILQSNQLTIFM